MEYNEKLRELRVQSGMSQDDLAEKLHVARQTISKWEQGVNEPDIYTLKQYATIFNVTIDDIVGDVEHVNMRANKRRKASRTLLVISTLFYVFSVLVIFTLLRFLQDTIPAHYNIKWEIDRYGSKTEVMWYVLGCTSMYAISLISYVIGKKYIGTKMPNLETGSYIVIFCTVLAAQIGFLAFALSLTVKYLVTDNVLSFIFCIVGALELVVAIATHPKITPTNGIAGFRTNFTLSNHEAWVKVNRFTSICIAVASALMIGVNMLFVSMWVALCSELLILVALLITLVYHEVLRKKMK
ncbi:MAG: helix-turn-helix domain-containing protein [Clostridiales bacterium]|nr:helix-turn-helix domain-containing protein [Clostridiales bacterium]